MLKNSYCRYYFPYFNSSGSCRISFPCPCHYFVMLIRHILLSTICLLLTQTCSCVGSVEHIFGNISLPNNLEVTVFTDDNRRLVGIDGVLKLIFNQLNPRITTSFLNSGIFYGESSSRHRILEDKVQLVLIFLHRNSTSFVRNYKQLGLILENQTASDKVNFWNPLHILIWPQNCKGSKENSLEENVENLQDISKKFSVSDDVYVIKFPCDTTNATVSDVSIWEFYSISNQSIYHKFGFKSRGFTNNPWHVLGNKISRRSNFEGARISATAPDDTNYSQESKFVQNCTSKFESGTSVLRYWFLRDSLNFSEFAVPDHFTSEDENGALTGGALNVVKGQVDISISQSAMTPFKKYQIDFLQPTDESILRAFFIQPPASKFRDIFISPFKADLWIAMFSTWLLITFSLRTFAWIQNRSQELDRDDQEIATDSWIWAIGTACQQGWHINPVSISIRIIFALGHLTGLVCFAAYSASIVSFLSLKAEPMKTFADLMNNSFKIFANEHSTPIAYILPELKIQPNFPKQVLIPESLSIPKIKDTKSAVVSYADVFSVEARLLNYTDLELCESIASVQINWVALRSGMIVRKGSPFKEFFDYQIMVMMEGGLNNRYLRMYNIGTETRCLQFTTGHKQALGIHDVLTAGIILFVGHVLSFVILIFEVLFAHRRNAKHAIMM